MGITIRALIGGVVGAVAGTFIGASIGGNYFTDFVFLGVRGYEATGLLGSILGAVFAVGIVLIVMKVRPIKKTLLFMLAYSLAFVAGYIFFDFIRGDEKLQMQESAFRQGAFCENLLEARRIT